MEKLLRVVKPFVGSFAKKELENCSRPVLKAALVTEKHIYATNSHIMVKVAHHVEEVEPHLFHYNPSVSGAYNVDSFPSFQQLERLFPEHENAAHKFPVNVKEWLECHKLALIAAKEVQPKNNLTHLLKDNVYVTKEGYNAFYEEPTFRHQLEKETPVDQAIYYNADYMIKVMNVLKGLNIKEVTCYYYGSFRPMYFVGNDVEIIMLPVRKN